MPNKKYKGEKSMKNIMITGAAGFIGANFAELMVRKYEGKYNFVIFDKLTYAGNIENLKNIKDKITFVKADICDFDKVMETYKKYNIDSVVHFAAESHVDNSIKKRNWNMYIDNTYSLNGECRLMSFNDILSIAGNNSLRSINAYYWLSSATNNSNGLQCIYSNGGVTGSRNICYGIRPVVTLKAECLFQNVNDENTMTHNTQETAWNLVI